MKIIEIEEDIYRHLLQNTSKFGETPSSVLKRLLKLDLRINQAREAETEIDQIINSTEFLYAKGVVGRFLTLLGAFHRLDKSIFARVEGIKGRGRIYFATNEEELHRSGKSVNPKKIPNSDYWVISTTPTPLKQDILEKVMNLYKFSDSDIRKAKIAIAG